jgi:hypothetical protein
VRAAAVEIGTQVREIDVAHAERLGPVDQRQDSAIARQAAQLARREDVAHGVGDVRESEEAGARRDRAFGRLEVVIGAQVRALDLEHLHAVAEPLRLGLPGAQGARVVVGEQQSLVARFQVEPEW